MTLAQEPVGSGCIHSARALRSKGSTRRQPPGAISQTAIDAAIVASGETEATWRSSYEKSAALQQEFISAEVFIAFRRDELKRRRLAP